MQPAPDRSFMFAQARIACAACRVPSIGSTSDVGVTTSCMTGDDRRSYNVHLHQVTQISLQTTLVQMS